MRTKQFFRVVIAAVAVSGASLTAAAQQQTSQTSAPQKKEAKPAPAKSSKVWSDDDLTSLRSPADIYAQQQQEAAAAAAAAAASAKQQSAAKASSPADPAPGRASGWNIKTPNDAQKAIDWDDRDIATQKELAANLQKKLDAAPPDQKARLQKALDERLQIIAGTQKDRDVIAVQKEKLEKKPAAPPQSQ